MSRALAATGLALGLGAATAATYNADPSTYLNAVSKLKPGDTLVLASGTYTQGLSLSGVNGAAGATISIQGPTDQSAVFLAQACCNTVQFGNSSFIAIRNLTLDGQHLDGPFGVDSGSPSHDITLENLLIINHDGSQQTDGISTKSPAWNWVIRHNTIIGAGTGMYFGNSDGTDPFVNGLIEDNLILDTIGYNIEIKYQLPRPTNVGLPMSDSRTIIRHNVFSKLNNGSTGGNARPNLLVGAFPPSGLGVKDLYEIYANFFYENPNEALFQAEGNVAFYDNLLVADTGDAIHIQSNNGPVQTITILNNTVVASGRGIAIANANTAYVQKIVGNAVFAATAISGPGQSQNITDTYAGAAKYLNAPAAPLGTLDLYPKAGQLADSAIDLTAFSALVDASLDFNGTARDGVVRGAYAGQGTNPGWRLARSIQTTGGATAPQVTLSASPTAVPSGGTSTLTWSATNATLCTASGGWSGAKATSGSEISVPLTADTTFSLTCSGAGGSTPVSTTVAVTASPSPTVTLSASPTSVPSGGTATLTWSTTNATSCTASGGWSGVKATSGTATSAPLSADTTFTLTCGSASDSVVVSVTATASKPGGGGALEVSALSCLGLLPLLRAWRHRRPANDVPIFS